MTKNEYETIRSALNSLQLDIVKRFDELIEALRLLNKENKQSR